MTLPDGTTHAGRTPAHWRRVALIVARMTGKCGPALWRRRSPPSVVATLRVVRVRSRTPSRASRARTVWLSADCDKPSFAAARVKLRSRATARLPVEVPQGSQFGAKGAALLAATAIGWFNSIATACRATFALDRRHEPDPAKRGDYDWPTQAVLIWRRCRRTGLDTDLGVSRANCANFSAVEFFIGVLDFRNPGGANKRMSRNTAFLGRSLRAGNGPMISTSGALERRRRCRR